MPARIPIPQRIVPHIAVPVQALRVARRGHYRVGLQETAERGVVISGVVKVQSDGVIKALAGVAVGRLQREVGVVVLAVGVAKIPKCLVAVFPQFDAGAVGDDAG